ncbi:MAG: TetR/AcrR family transcriptional regulator [Burkholderiales bacterium]
MSPRNDEQNEQLKDERREQILSAALKVFGRRGFAATKISDIVTSAGMSHGLVYHYFKSKEEIFYELLKRAMTASSQALLEVEGMPLSPIEKVRQTAKFILGGIEGFKDSAYYFLIVAHASVMETPGAQYEELINTSDIPVHAMARILAAGQQADEIKDGDVYGMALTFFAAIQGLAIYKLAIKDFNMPDPEILVNMVRK